MINWLALYIKTDDQEFAHITPHISFSLFYLGLRQISKIYCSHTINNKYKILIILTLIFSTISDGLFILNGYIPLIDRYLGILTILVTMYRIKYFPICYNNRYFQIKIIMAFYFFVNSRNSRTYIEWNNNHFIWHVLVFDVLNFIIDNGIYLDE